MYGVFYRALFTILQNEMIVGNQIDLPRGSKISNLVHTCETILVNSALSNNVQCIQ